MLVLFQPRWDRVCAPMSGTSLVALSLHNWRLDGSEQPCRNVPRILSRPRSMLVPIWQLEIILGRAAFQSFHRGPFHIPIERITSVLPRFALPPTAIRGRGVGRVMLVIVPRRFWRCRIRGMSPRAVHGRIDVLVVRESSLDRFLERTFLTGRRRAGVEVDHTRTG